MWWEQTEKKNDIILFSQFSSGRGTNASIMTLIITNTWNSSFVSFYFGNSPCGSKKVSHFLCHQRFQNNQVTWTVSVCGPELYKDIRLRSPLSKHAAFYCRFTVQQSKFYSNCATSDVPLHCFPRIIKHSTCLWERSWKTIQNFTKNV